MKKTLLLIVLGLITVFCICFGTYRYLGGFKSIFKDGEINISFDDDDKEDEVSDASGKYSIDEKLEKFSAIKIDTAVMGITIEEGKDFKIESSYNKEYLKPQFSISGGKLNITQARRKNGIKAGSQNCRVIITIPSGSSLSSIDINSNVGDVKLRELKAENIGIDLNVGEIDIRNVDFSDIDCNNNVGEITINPIDSLDEYDISISTDVGDVRVDGRSYKRSYNSRGNGHKKIKANTNVGEINVK